jgi:outer membrane biogenesis lipoprotein LolB
MMMKLQTVLSAVVWLLYSASTAEATVSASQINRYWTDANEILDDLDNYQALWVKFHNCVYVSL